ncbi:hypothetical protein LWI29_013418 [Acer saccharum]|uniref:Uncharacterized protein n=1 Tax=Acer saccharum TaxID=4024 RepID=A0AA39W2D9_ACESA|nr:hypothetical protein LWI29_013418 [Acer saccharum]
MYSLGLLRGCLCLSTERYIYNSQFWVMKDYDVKGSWTRILIPDMFYWLKPLCYLNTGDTMLLFMNLHQLVFCNPKDGKIKYIEVDGIPDEIDDYDDADWLDIDMYVESLVSPYYKRDFKTEGLQQSRVRDEKERLEMTREVETFERGEREHWAVCCLTWAIGL